MSDFLRPEARAALHRHAQTITGLVLVALALWWMTISFGVMRWLGGAVLLLGLGVAVEGYRRARLTRAANGLGPGLVEIDERQITWFSGHFGGSVAMDGLATVDIQITDEGEALWIFVQTDGQRLMVPASALGAERIMDALSALPGLNYEAAIAAMSARSRARYRVWQDDRLRLAAGSGPHLT